MKYIRTKDGIKKFTDEEAKALRPAPSYKELRKKEYGTVEQQIEYIVENGLEAFKQKVWEIKARIQKPKTLSGM